MSTRPAINQEHMHRYADIVAGDGLDDFVCIGKDGSAYASINQGDGNNLSPPTFKGPALWKTAVKGYDQSHVRLADIDGDGRGDYCVTADNGDVRCWRNGGQGDLADYWQDLGIKFTGKGMGDTQGTHFEDINGDVRNPIPMTVYQI